MLRDAFPDILFVKRRITFNLNYLIILFELANLAKLFGQIGKYILGDCFLLRIKRRKHVVSSLM